MIAHLRGTLAAKFPGEIVVDVGGTGYQVFVSLNTFCELPHPGGQVSLSIYTHVRENALQLFGFASELERDVFELLLHASRVGPKLALTVLSGLEAERVLAAIRGGNPAALQVVSGVGAKLAQRIVLELRDRAFERFGAGETETAAEGAPAQGARAQLLSALVNLQVPRSQAERIVDEVVAEHGAVAPIEALETLP